jgi:hypothetical protein
MVRISANSKSPKMQNKKVDFIRARLALFKEDPAHFLFSQVIFLFSRRCLNMAALAESRASL